MTHMMMTEADEQGIRFYCAGCGYRTTVRSDAVAHMTDRRNHEQQEQ